MHCHHCGKHGAALKSCSRCKSVFYCNQKCQKTAWKKHKKVCRSLHQKRTAGKSENLKTRNMTKKEETNKCGYCKKDNTDNIFQRCSSCKDAVYCSKTCQKADWNHHKKSCKKFRNIEQQFHQLNQSTSVPSGQVAQMNDMFKMLSFVHPEKAMELQDKCSLALYDSIPVLHNEFIELVNQGEIMRRIDVQVCYQLLKEVYDLNSGLYMHEISLARPSPVNPLVTEFNLLKRLLTNDPDIIKWFYTSQIGDIRANPGLPYDPNMWQSFSNARSRSMILTTGTTHVAVGFVDLTTLLWMHLKEEPQPKVECPSRPLYWIGYEASTFCCAKTLVIRNMLVNKCECDSIIEVWYSSTWSDSTSLAFFSTVRQLLEQNFSHQNDQGLSVEVLSILHDWSSFEQQPIPLNKARKDWLKSVGAASFLPLLNCMKRQDRNELSQYLLTGQVFQETTYGSVTMFGVSPTLGARARNESLFHSICLKLLAETSLSKGLSLLSSAIYLLRQRVDYLQDKVMQGKVVIEIRAPVIVSANNPSILSEIRGTEPYTISWNNVLDYNTSENFHLMARQCSAEENTVHFGYSMNWPVYVKGASCLDYGAGKHMKLLLEVGRNGISRLYKIYDIDKPSDISTVLKIPPIDNPMNIIEFALYMGRYRDWLNVFFKDVHNVADIEMSGYSPFARTNSTIFMTWSYDESLSFRGIANDLN